MRALCLAMAMTWMTAVAVADDTAKSGAEGAKATDSANTAAKADATANTAGGTTTCTSGSDTRTLTITKGDGYACQLKYTKAGADTFPAQAKNDPAYCDGKLTAIKDKLVAAGFKCE